MHILLASATTNEISPTLAWLKDSNTTHIAPLITGIGGIVTTHALMSRIKTQRPGIIIQAGIGGSFSELYPPGAVVCINEEVMADLGAFEEGQLTDIFDMGLAAVDKKPFAGRMLPNPYQQYEFGLDFVRGATVNGISASPTHISIIQQKYNPVIESMEGAALHWVCLMENIPFLQLRGVSNFVGERNKANWKFTEAIVNLNDKLKLILKQLADQ